MSAAEPAGEGRRAVLITLLASLASACAGSESAPAVAAAPTETRALYPDELVPADLDVVVRVDVGEAVRALGEKAAAADRLFANDPLFARALAGAETVTVAVRLRHLAEGDRVAVLEFPSGKPLLTAAELTTAGFEEAASPHARARVFLRAAEVGRADTQAVVLVEEGFAAFVTPAEVDAVLRVLARGPDEFRGRPLATGIVSVDMRPGRLPARYETRYKHIAKVVASVSRVKAKLDFVDDALVFDCNFFTESDDAAVDLRAFFDALAENAPDSSFGRVVGSVQRNAVGTVMHLRARVPLEMAAALWADAEREGPANVLPDPVPGAEPPAE